MSGLYTSNATSRSIRLVDAPVYSCPNPSVETATLIPAKAKRRPREAPDHWNNTGETSPSNLFQPCLQ